MSKKKRIYKPVMVVILGICIMQSVPAFAAGPGENEQKKQADIPAHLQDGILEYGELMEMIHYYNPSTQTLSTRADKERKRYADTLDILVAERDVWHRKAKNVRDDMKEDEGNEDKEEKEIQYMDYQAQEAACKAAIKSYQSMLKKLDSHSATKDRRKLELDMTNSAQSLMISYEIFRLQKELAEQTLALRNNQYELAQLKRGIGVSTEADILEAKTEVAAAAADLSAVEGNIQTIYQEICYLTGQPFGGSLVISEIPPVEPDRIERLNLEEDIKKAIINNDTIISYRRKSGKGSSALEDKSRRLDEAKENVTISMRQLYEEVKRQRQVAQTANDSSKRAEQKQNLLERQYQEGMVSREAYLEQKLLLLRQKTDSRIAGLELLRSVETYDSAVRGILEI